MPQIFISHATANDIQAEALRNHLNDNGFGREDVFLDHSIEGIGAHDRWKEALAAANASAIALICLASRDWLDSRWSQIEVGVASQLKQMDRFRARAIIAVLVGGVTRAEMRAKGFTEEQIIDLKDEAALTLIRHVRVGDTIKDEAFSTVALTKLRRALEQVGASAETFPWTPSDSHKPSPYPGLEAFNEREVGVFFGREANLAEALTEIDTLRTRDPSRVVTIIAPSGAGKSSFLRAGLWPRLKRRNGFAPLAIVRPLTGVISDKSGGLIAAMADWFTGNGQSIDMATVRDWVGDTITRDGLIRLLSAAQHITGPGNTFVLGIDQAEELFDDTDSRRIAEAQQFQRALFELLTDPAPGLDLMVVSTIRADSWDRLAYALQAARDAALQRNAPNTAALEETAITLAPLADTAYRDVITEPIRVAYREGERVGRIMPRQFEPALVDHLVATFKGADALPLLAMTLEQLYEQHAAQQTITRAHYEAMYRALGHGAGPVSRALEDAYRSAGEAGTPETLKRLIVPGLATWDQKTGTAKRIVADVAHLFGGARAGLEPLSEALVEARLLTRGSTTLEVAHEALLRLPPVSTWIETEKDRLRQRDEIQREREQWEQQLKGSYVQRLIPAWAITKAYAAERRGALRRLNSLEATDEYLVRRGDRLLSSIELASTPGYDEDLFQARKYLSACKHDHAH